MILRYLAQRLKARLVYRVDFLVNAVGDLLLAAVGLVFLAALFEHVPRLGRWQPAEVLFVWGFAESAVGLFFVAFHGLWQLNQRYLLGGELDRVLLRPLDPYVQLLLDNVSVEDLPILVLGLAVMACAAPGLEPVEAWRWLLLPVAIAGAAAVLGGLLTAVCSVGFHLHHRGTAVGLVFQLASFTRFPIDLFARPLRWMLTFALPLGFAGFYPATFFLGRDEWLAYALVQPLVGLGALAAGYAAWRVGLERYTSSGS